MHRADILRRAIHLTSNDRNKTYGHPFENMSALADLMTAYLKNKYSTQLTDQFILSAEDAAHFMQFGKIARTMQGTFHADNYVDASCYEAIAGECRAIDESDDLLYPKEMSIPEAHDWTPEQAGCFPPEFTGLTDRAEKVK